MDVLNLYVVAVIMAICLGVGFIIKHSLTFVKNKYIPLILGVLGIVLNSWLNGFEFNPQILLGGLSSGLAATGAFEFVRHIKNGSK